MARLLAVQEPLRGWALSDGARLAFWDFRAPARLVASQGMDGGDAPEARTVGQRLAVAIVLRGLPDKEVARLAAVSPKWLGSLKKDRIKQPSADKLRAVARVLKVPLRHLAEPMGWYEDEVAGDWERLSDAIVSTGMLTESQKRGLLLLLRPQLAVQQEEDRGGRTSAVS